jgi:hypothetical protein
MTEARPAAPSLPATPPEPGLLHRWNARRLPPVILLWVALVFVAFMALSYILRSTTAVTALAAAAVAALVPLVPAVISRLEYRMTEAGVDQRPLAGKPGDFRATFRWEELDRIVPGRRGFKFYKRVHEPRRWRRFWKRHIEEAWSGEVHVERPDLPTVLALLAERGVSGAMPRGRGAS